MTEIPSHPRHRPWPPTPEEDWLVDGTDGAAQPGFEDEDHEAESDRPGEWIFAAAIVIVWTALVVLAAHALAIEFGK